MRSSDLVMLSAALLVGLGMTAAVRGSRLAKARAIETEQAGLAPPPAEAESGEMDHSKMDPGEMDQGEMDHSKMDHSKMGESDQSAEAAGVIDLKNEKCPVRGGDADPDVYVDYEGVRVHFCCPGCEGDFLKEPQKYLKKLGIDDLDAYKAKHGSSAGGSADIIDLKNEKCPVLGGDADPDVYVDYEGVRVHFCCPGCEGDFLKEPQKYLKKLGIDDLDAYKAKHGGQE